MEPSNPLSEVPLTNTTPATAESSAGQAVSQNATSIQTPPLTVMMQQAVALQQYQFQQALLMQQVMAAQQAATRAATLKSATEMAAARAAEISKKIKGSDAEDEKPVEGSKSRSISKSPSGSPSRSRSKSRSRSPIRYRRGRSGSRSPIRYRREHYSPSRIRDYYGYRSRGYRGYYRGGRNDYSWSMYRRGRDRDYHYRSSRRSRSRGRRRSRTKSRSPRRSRSRARRRSRTTSRSPRRRRRSRTRSPRHRREKSTSPKQKREERKSHRTSKRSVSRDPTRSASASSGSTSESPSRKDGSTSPSKLLGGSERVSNAESPSQEENTAERKICGSPSHTDQGLDEERIASSRRKGGNRVSPAKSHSSNTPDRSLSVSLDNDKTYHMDARGTSPDKDCKLQTLEMSDGSNEKQSNLPVGALMEEVDLKEPDGGKLYHSAMSNQGGDSLAEAVTVRESASNSNAMFDDEESEYDEVLDDWRDDLKTASKQKGHTVHGSIEMDKKVDKGSSFSDVQRPNFNCGALSDFNPNYDRIQGSASSEEESKDKVLRGEMSEQEAIPTKGSRSWILNSKGDDTFPEGMCVSNNDGVDHVIDKEYAEGKGGEESNEAVFEGPRPAGEDFEEGIERGDSGRSDPEAYATETELLPGRHENERHVIVPAETRTFVLRDIEGGDNGAREMAGDLDKEEKVRDRSRSKDSKKHGDDVTKREKRRDRHHKKHKKRHRHEDVDQEAVDAGEQIKDEGDVHRSRKRHKRRHKKEDEHGHKKKKRKHKHRVQSPSDSAEGSPLADGDEGIVMRKKSSKRHKKSKQDKSESLHPSATSS